MGFFHVVIGLGNHAGAVAIGGQEVAGYAGS